ncbi:MAG TPA: SCO family protein [Phycisphaerales bacterium]|nr:SCO family protein [Phycisphaerales bacterium]
MPKWLIAVVVIVSTVLVLFTLAVLTRPEPRVITPVGTERESAGVETDGATGGRRLTPRPGLEGLKIPDFSLVNQAGEPVDQSVLDGRVSVVAFIFTNCQLACPPMTGAMLRMYHALGGAPVRFVSISVDPVHDTPERLTEYAARLSVDTGRWMFLTGGEGETARIVAESLKFAIAPDPDDANLIPLPDGSTMRNISHPIKLFLVGPERQILDFCTPTIAEDLDRFVEVARETAG